MSWSPTYKIFVHGESWRRVADVWLSVLESYLKVLFYTKRKILIRLRVAQWMNTHPTLHESTTPQPKAESAKRISDAATIAMSFNARPTG